MLRILILSLALMHMGASIELKTNCLKGPQYWCKSIIEAKECNAVAHCIQTVWTKHASYLHKEPIKVSINPNKCSNCVQCMIGDLRRCPNVRDYKDEVTELLSYNLPSESICKLIGQCDDSHFDQESKKNPTDLNKPSIDLNVNKFDSRFECGLHPRNWCNNLETALQCHSFEKCLLSWSQSSFKYKLKDINVNDKDLSPRVCGFCLFIFNKLQSIIQENKTEINIESYLNGACALLPSKEETEKCLNSVSIYLPQIYNLIRSNIDSGIICRVIRLCEDSHLDQIEIKNTNKPTDYPFSKIKIKNVNSKETIIKTPFNYMNREENLVFGVNVKKLISELNPSDGSVCELSGIVLTGVKHLIDSKVNNEKILDFVQTQLCKRVGSFEDSCNKYMKNNLDDILKQLKSKVHPSILSYGIGLCNKFQVDPELLSGSKSIKTKQRYFDLEAKNDENCDLCRSTIDQVKKMMEEKKTQAEIIDFINSNLCSKLGNQEQLCESYVKTYSQIILGLIAADCDSQVLCEMIGVCAPSANLIEHTKIEIQSDSTCVLCQFVMTLLSDYIKKNHTESSIENGLTFVCNHEIPSVLRKDCNTFIQEYSPMIIELLKDEVCSGAVCAQINVCPSKQSAPKLIGAEEKLINEILNGKKIGSDVTCVVCQFVATLASRIINKNETEAEIMKGLNFVCNNVFPHSYKNSCLEFIETNAEQLIELLIDNANPETVCEILGECALSKKSNIISSMIVGYEKQFKNQILDPNSCTSCEISIDTLRRLIDQDQSEEVIKKSLEAMCIMLPEKSRDSCMQFVDNFAIQIIQFIGREINSEGICQLFGFCHPNNNNNAIEMLQNKVLELINKKPNDPNGVCKTCLITVDNLKRILANEKSETELIKKMEATCDTLEEKDRETCKQIVDGFIAQAIKFIAQDISSNGICEMFGFCKLNSKSIDNLNSKEFESFLRIKAMKIFKINNQNRDDACEKCKDTVELIEIHLTFNMSDDLIKKHLELICFACPAKNECISFVDKYFSQILSFLKENANPTAVCKKIGFCESKDAENQIEMKTMLQNIVTDLINPQNQDPNGVCKTCLITVDNLKRMLANEESETELIKKLEAMCDTLEAKDRETCQQIVDGFIAQAIKFIAQDISSNGICEMFGFCRISSKSKSSIQIELVDIKEKAKPNMCSTCKFVSSKLKSKYQNTAIEKENIREYLKHICNNLAPDNMRDICNDLNYKYADILINLISYEVEINSICQIAGVCPSNLIKSESFEKEKDIFIQKSNKIAALQKESLSKPEDLISKLLWPHSIKEKDNSLECTVCVYLAQLVDYFLAKNLTQQEITSELEKACNYFPSQLRAQCTSVVEEYGPYVFKLISEDMDAQTACTEIGLCNDNNQVKEKLPSIDFQKTKPIRNFFPLLEDDQPNPNQDSLKCVLCVYAAEIAESLLAQNKTELEIVSHLKLVCNLFPRELDDQCNSFIDTYAVFIIKMISEHLDPRQVCDTLKLCTQNKYSSFLIKYKLRP